MASLAAVAFSGCLADVLVSTAIQGELQAKQAQTAVRALNKAKGTKSEIEVNNAIQTFAAEHGRNPASLEELVPEHLAVIPTKPDGTPYGYDPSTGSLLDAPLQPAAAVRAPVNSNGQKIQQMNQAITKYGMTVGYYPPTLDALVPNYLPTLPLTVNGVKFVYDNQTGKVWDPTGTLADTPTAAGGGGSLAQTPPQQGRQPRPVGVGGGSPVLGETMTGIAISNELNSMSSAGSSAAGSAARSDARGIGQSRDDAQQKAMDDLGF